MATRYHMDIAVHDIAPGDDRDKAIKAIQDLWPGEVLVNGDHLIIAGEGSLSIGVSEEDFASSVAQAVWEVIGFRAVNVSALCLENIPREAHWRGTLAYSAWQTTR